MMDLMRLGVFHSLNNRLEGLSDDSPWALELHPRRRTAPDEAFDASGAATFFR